MAVSTPDSGFEALERRYERLAHVIVYVLLAVPLLPYWLSQNPSAGAIGITAGVAAAAAARYQGRSGAATKSRGLRKS